MQSKNITDVIDSFQYMFVVFKTFMCTNVHTNKLSIEHLQIECVYKHQDFW